MLSRLGLDLPTAAPTALDPKDVLGRLDRAEQEHRRLMEALTSFWDRINKDDALEISGAVFPTGSTTPTVTSASGTITTVSATLSYSRYGNRVAFDALITLTTNGTGAGHLILPLPFTPAASRPGVGRVPTLAQVLDVDLNVNGTALIRLYDGTYPGADGRTFAISGVYRV